LLLLPLLLLPLLLPLLLLLLPPPPLLLLLLLLQELYVPVPVPEQLRFVEGKDDSAFDFLERELRFAV
jgi:hypothetical protein